MIENWFSKWLKKYKVKRILKKMSKKPYWYIKRGGYKGYQGASRICPVARCLQHKLDDPRIIVGRNQVFWRNYYGEGFFVDLPRSVQNFIYEFDSGYFHDLVEKGHPNG